MSKAVMQQALEALEGLADYRYTDRVKNTMASLRQAIAEHDRLAGIEMLEKQAGIHVSQQAKPEQEPVAHTTGHCENHKQKGGCQLHNLQCGWPDCDRKPITTPLHRKPLTDEEIERACVPLGAAMLSFTEVARAIERAHGIGEQA